MSGSWEELLELPGLRCLFCGDGVRGSLAAAGEVSRRQVCSQLLSPLSELTKTGLLDAPGELGRVSIPSPAAE